jgi:hypothetical protein
VNTYYALLALDLANERSREAEEMRLARLVREARGQDGESYDWLPSPDVGSGFRRGLARATAAVSLGAAAVTRRLDGGIADDLGLASD